MLKKLFGAKNKEPIRQGPEVMGLHLGGAFELDALRLKLIESDLIVEGVAPTQLIQAVGDVQLDTDTRLLRFYTDDDGFLQVILSGGNDERHVSDVKLWYYYDTKTVANSKDWDKLLSHTVSQPVYELEGHSFTRVWQSTGDSCPPVAMTEQTYSNNDSNQLITDETDQFAMLYEREASDGLFEYLYVTAEEKIIDNRADRCLVISTGFDIRQADMSIIG